MHIDGEDVCRRCWAAKRAGPDRSRVDGKLDVTAVVSEVLVNAEKRIRMECWSQALEEIRNAKNPTGLADVVKIWERRAKGLDD